MSNKEAAKEIKAPAAAASAAAYAADTKPSAKKSALSSWDQKILDATLWEFTAGIPRLELNLMIEEANECEKALKEEIKLLEEALQKEGEALDPKVQALLESPFTPMDRHWTLSALLGRLRGELSPPTLVSVQANKPSPPPPASHTMESAKQLLEMRQNPAYRREHPSPATLLPIWKKISSNRLAIVFKKPVHDEDAPGYSARIRFPMDLSLVRKLINSRHIKSIADLHVYIGLIAHNCVKYNGRETDYGIVAREFEQMADEVIRHAVLADSLVAASTTTITSAPATAAAAEVGGAASVEEEKTNS